MTKTPFTSQSERVSDLLVLVHTDVFEPMISVTNSGFSTSLLLHMTLVDMDTLT
jgi:hypothetical protein